jgi:hypothetical protein
MLTYVLAVYSRRRQEQKLPILYNPSSIFLEKWNKEEELTIFCSVGRIRIGYMADPDPAF